MIARWAAPDTPTLPQVLAFAPPSPNPLIDRAHLSWEIPAGHEGETFDLSLYDLAGRRVITVANGPVHAGRFSADWMRRDVAGERVHGGVYFARLRIGARYLNQKLVVTP